MAENSKKKDEAVPEEQAAQQIPSVARVQWDDSQMVSTFANVINVLHTREEFSLLFGANQTWNLVEPGTIKVNLTNRMVLTPFAAKRLMRLLSQHVEEYEARLGKLPIDE